MDTDVPLGWYAGNEEIPDLQTQLVRLLERISDCTGARLLIIGGSGGGYAAIQLGLSLRCRTSVLVWNPQTAIADYVPKFVTQYLCTAFPKIAAAATAVL